MLPPWLYLKHAIETNQVVKKTVTFSQKLWEIKQLNFRCSDGTESIKMTEVIIMTFGHY